VKRFSYFYTGRETENMAWVTVDKIGATLGYQISKTGVNTCSNQEKNLAFVNNILVN